MGLFRFKNPHYSFDATTLSLTKRRLGRVRDDGLQLQLAF